MEAIPLCACGCGSPVTVDKRRGRVSRFVSGHNTRNHRKPRIERACLQCEKVFSGTVAAMTGRVYCSPDCRDNHRRTRTPPRTEKPCMVCGVSASFTSAQVRRGRLYCSPACSRIAWRSKVTGPRALKGGDGLDANRRAALRRDGHRCRFCRFDLGLHVHHIIPKGKGGGHVLQNLITLCPNHHVLAHAGLLAVEEMRQAILHPRRPGTKAMPVNLRA